MAELHPGARAGIRTYTLAGGHNFRDMGGYATADGRSVQWRMLFRSGTLNRLTRDDLEALAPLGIRLIFDLRTNREREAFPTRWHVSPKVERWSRDHEISRADLAAVVESSEPGSRAALDMTLALYRKLPFEQAESYAELLRRIADRQLPVVFHCSAGKDRTGAFAAILLTLLGVDRKIIFEDYELTDECYDQLCEMFMRDRKIHDMEHVDIDRLAPLLRAQPTYLEAMLVEIEERHGTVAGYVRNVLGIEDSIIERVREALLI